MNRQIDFTRQQRALDFLGERAAAQIDERHVCLHIASGGNSNDFERVGAVRRSEPVTDQLCLPHRQFRASRSNTIDHAGRTAGLR